MEENILKPILAEPASCQISLTSWIETESSHHPHRILYVKITDPNRTYIEKKKQEDSVDFDLEDTIPSRTLLSEQPGYAQISFVREDELEGYDPDSDVCPPGVVKIKSKFVKAEPKGKGLGSDLCETYGKVLQYAANKCGKVVAHPVTPWYGDESDPKNSANMFLRQGYLPDANHKYSDKNSDSYEWTAGVHVKEFIPQSASIVLTQEEEDLYRNFCLMYPELSSKY